MSAPSNIHALAEKAAEITARIGFDPARDDPFELDHPDVFRDSGLFEPEAIARIFGNKDVATTSPDEAEELEPSTLYPQAIGMVLVRPDMLHIAPQVEEFVGDRFEIIDSVTTEVGPEVYWQMYSEAIVGRETRNSRLSRAAIYVGSACQMIVFRAKDSQPTEEPTADYVYEQLKGKQGVAQPDTLRGELVLEGALAIGAHQLVDRTVALALDPFGAYRKIVREDQNGPHASLAHPLLFYTGVGVHVPNYQEMQRDLALLDAAGQMTQASTETARMDERDSLTFA